MNYCVIENGPDVCKLHGSWEKEFIQWKFSKRNQYCIIAKVYFSCIVFSIIFSGVGRRLACVKN